MLGECRWCATPPISIGTAEPPMSKPAPLLGRPHPPSSGRPFPSPRAAGAQTPQAPSKALQGHSLMGNAGCRRVETTGAEM